MTEDTVRVGVLSLHNSKESKAICNAIEALGHEPAWLREENTVVRTTDDGVELEPDVDVIVNRLLLSNTPQPCEALGLASTVAQLRPTLNQPAATMTATHKIAAGATLAEADVPVPRALFALSSARLDRERDAFGEEAVYKTAIGTHGGGTWKIGPDDTVGAQVGNRYAFLQELIERGDERARDLRAYVVDGEVVGAMYRYAPENDWRTNVALGGSVEDAIDDLTPELRGMAADAADAVGLDVAGVDLVESADGWKVLEVNPTAGFKGLHSATGISPAPHIAQLAIERGGGAVDEAAVARLEATLDDSVPDCKPEAVPTRRSEPTVIGYTEEVTVTGTSGSRTVTAKSDTGATRTSVDTSLAADVGAGPIKSVARVKSGSVKGGKSRPVVDLVVGVGGTQHTVTASVEDRGHMEYPLLLGRDILEHYRVDVRRRADAGGSGADEATAEEEAEE